MTAGQSLSLVRRMNALRLVKTGLLAFAAVATLSSCNRPGTMGEGGIYVTRSTCPQVGIPAGTGDVTLFNPPGRTDAAAIDPLADPMIRDAVAKATFEQLIGFQLTQDQLRYNATR